MTSLDIWLQSARRRLGIPTFLALASVAVTELGAQKPTPPVPTAAASGGTSTAPHDSLDAPAQSAHGWSYDRDVGFVYRRHDFRWISWGFAERHWGVAGSTVHTAFWRRARQGMEFDLPRFAVAGIGSLRPAVVYELDATDNNFFRTGSKWKVWENLYVALQDTEDPSRLRVVFGENTHILAYEDNLSSGNLPTINRALILEEHGSTNSFGTQWGLQATKALTSRLSLAVSAQDNRGSLNTDRPRWAVGNSLAAKLTAQILQDTIAHRRFSAGAAVDHTRNIQDRSFTLASAIVSTPLGGTEATGNKLTGETFFAYTGSLAASGNHPYSIEGEGLWSRYGATATDVRGGYVQLQVSLFDTPSAGDADPFLRYDDVRLARSSVSSSVAHQSAVRAGVNYNLPYTNKRANLHVEAAWNRVRGPAELVPVDRAFREVTVGLRINATRYIRH